jgi:hypothetical protein
MSLLPKRVRRGGATLGRPKGSKNKPKGQLGLFEKERAREYARQYYLSHTKPKREFEKLVRDGLKRGVKEITICRY